MLLKEKYFFQQFLFLRKGVLRNGKKTDQEAAVIC